MGREVNGKRFRPNHGSQRREKVWCLLSLRDMMSDADPSTNPRMPECGNLQFKTTMHVHVFKVLFTATRLMSPFAFDLRFQGLQWSSFSGVMSAYLVHNVTT